MTSTAEQEFLDWFVAGPAELTASPLLTPSGLPIVVWHGTTAVNRHGAKMVQGSAQARQHLVDLCKRLGMPEDRSGDVASVLERWVTSQKDVAERYGVDHALATQAREWTEQARAKTVEEPRVELAFERFELPHGGKELGAHFGTKQQASARGEPFPFVLRLKSPIRLPDLGTWDYQLVMRELRRAGVEITEAQYDAVFNAPFGMENQHLRELLMTQGIDGIVYANEAEGAGDSYIVFDADQVWSLSHRPVNLESLRGLLPACGDEDDAVGRQTERMRG